MKKSGFSVYLIVVLTVFSTYLYAVETDAQMAIRLAQELLKPEDAGVESSQFQAMSLYTNNGFKKNNPDSISKPNEKEAFRGLIERQACDCGKRLVGSEAFIDGGEVFDPDCHSHRVHPTPDYHPVILYHGTSSNTFENYTEKGIVVKGKGHLGEGYYLTTDRRTAYEYARMRSREIGSNPMILSYQIDPDLQVKGFKEEDKKKVFIKDQKLKLLQDTSSPDRYNQFIVPKGQDLTKLLLVKVVTVLDDALVGR